MEANYKKLTEQESMIFDMSTGLLTYTSIKGNYLSIIIDASHRKDIPEMLKLYEAPITREIINSMFLRLYVDRFLTGLKDVQ